MSSQSFYKHLPFRFPNSTSPERFTIEVDPKLIQFAKDRARTYRVSHGVSKEWTNEGAPTETVANLAKYWADTYEWKAVEDRINSKFEHYATTIPGNRNYNHPIPIHFIHRRSTNKGATPLLLIHGWTSSHLLWSEIFDRLSDKFHLVAPDLPGYGFSPAPNHPGLGPREIGSAFNSMMNQLGYDKYGITTTDLGLIVGLWMTVDVEDSIIGHFTDFLLALPTPADVERATKGETTPEENEYMTTMNLWNNNHFAYASIQGQKPLALSYSMADSPVGYAAWIWDLKRVSSDDHTYTSEEIITASLMSWIQEPYGSLRAYLEFLKPETFGAIPKSNVPAGVTQWGNKDGPVSYLAKYPLAPREWADRLVNVAFFKRYDFGGHFPSQFQPDLYARDLQEFFSSL